MGKYTDHRHSGRGPSGNRARLRVVSGGGGRAVRGRSGTRNEGSGMMMILSALAMAVVGGGIGYWAFDRVESVTRSAASDDPESARFGTCFGPVRHNCVVDGDTFWYSGRKIRIADINTPELDGAECDYERQLGERAKARLRTLLNQGNFTLEHIDRDQDRFGRDLRIVTRNGESLGDILVAEGLAEEWQGYRRYWC